MARDYIIYGSMPWAGPWNVEHNVAHALGAQHRVLFVDPPLTPASPFRYGLSDTSRRQLRELADRRVRASGRVQVFTPLALPPLTDARAWRASLPLVRAQVTRAVRRAGLSAPVAVAWRYLDSLAGAAGEVLRVGVVMDHVASAAQLLHRDADELQHEVDALCGAADLICVPSRPVQELLATQGHPSELLAFGFAHDLAPRFDAASEPPEYAALPRPILGYTGSIDDRLDYELIVALADRFAHGSLAFVGAVSPRLSPPARAALASRPNIHVLGTRPRDVLPAYIRHLDCALLPYADMLFTRYQSPMKLWEYLYAGPPIVGTGALELRRYPPPLVHFCTDAGHAPDAVQAALDCGGEGARRRRDFALANTWGTRARELEALVQARLTSRRAAA